MRIDLGELTATEVEWLQQALAVAIITYTEDGERHAGRIAFLQGQLHSISAEIWNARMAERRAR